MNFVLKYLPWVVRKLGLNWKYWLAVVAGGAVAFASVSFAARFAPAQLFWLLGQLGVDHPADRSLGEYRSTIGLRDEQIARLTAQVDMEGRRHATDLATLGRQADERLREAVASRDLQIRSLGEALAGERARNASLLQREEQLSARVEAVSAREAAVSGREVRLDGLERRLAEANERARSGGEEAARALSEATQLRAENDRLRAAVEQAMSSGGPLNATRQREAVIRQQAPPQADVASIGPLDVRYRTAGLHNGRLSVTFSVTNRSGRRLRIAVVGQPFAQGALQLYGSFNVNGLRQCRSGGTPEHLASVCELSILEPSAQVTVGMEFHARPGGNRDDPGPYVVGANLLLVGRDGESPTMQSVDFDVTPRQGR